MHHRGGFFARAVLDGGCVDFGGNGGHFFFIGVAQACMSQAAFYRFRIAHRRHSVAAFEKRAPRMVR